MIIGNYYQFYVLPTVDTTAIMSFKNNYNLYPINDVITQYLCFLFNQNSIVVLTDHLSTAYERCVKTRTGGLCLIKWLFNLTL